MTFSNADSTRQIEITPQEVVAALKSTLPPRLLDVRTPEEWELTHIDGTTLITEVFAKEMLEWTKDTPIVFYCHHGQRSLNAASYFIEQGFTNVRSMTGGIDTWSLEINSSIPRY